MAECRPVKVRDGLDLVVWRAKAGDTVSPQLVDFRPLTVAGTKGVGLEGTLDPEGGRWFPLTADDGTPTGLRDRLTLIRERVYQVRPVLGAADGELWLHMGRP